MKNNEQKQWYAIQVYSGYENAVMKNLKQRISSLNMSSKIFDVIVPMEKKLKIKNGKRVEVIENIYPGYILVQMLVDKESWFVVRNTERVTGFVGAGTEPVPLSDEEVETVFSRMKTGKIKHETDFSVGESVKIIDGPFSNLEGKIEEVDVDRGKIKVLVPMFGQDTPVEIDFVQVKQI